MMSFVMCNMANVMAIWLCTVAAHIWSSTVVLHSTFLWLQADKLIFIASVAAVKLANLKDEPSLTEQDIAALLRWRM